MSRGSSWPGARDPRGARASAIHAETLQLQRCPIKLKGFSEPPGAASVPVGTAPGPVSGPARLKSRKFTLCKDIPRNVHLLSTKPPRFHATED